MARLLGTIREARAKRGLPFGDDAQSGGQPVFSLGTLLRVLAAGAIYYLTTRAAWVLTFPDSKVALFFPPHAVLVAILVLVPTRHWWAYVLVAASSHYFATQQAHWPALYALQCEVFDAAKYVLTAAGIRLFIKSRFHLITLREAVSFVLVATLVPMVTALWGAAFTVAYGFGTRYWIEWRNLSISNSVTAIVLVPVILIGAHRLSTKTPKAAPRRVLQASALAVGLLAVGYLVFNQPTTDSHTPPALLYAPVPLLIWAALRFGLVGISASSLVITIIAIWGTMRGRGPFLTQSATDNALALQTFMLMMATPLMLLAVAIDDERRSKERLRVSEERMSMAVESAQLALWDWDVADDSLWITDVGRKFFGFAPDEPLHYASLAGRVHPDDSALRVAAIERALETGNAYETEYRLLMPDGSVRWISARGRPGTTGADARPRILGVSLDITRQRVADAEAAQQQEELAHLSRVATVSALSSSLAHELSQPLSSILFNAQAGQYLLTRDVPDVAEVRAIFDDIVSQDRNASQIIDGLRTMLRRGEVALQPVRVNESVDELLRLMRSNLAVRGVAVSNLVANDLPPAMTDRVQLQQVLLNLVLNACDAMASNAPAERRLTITAHIEKDEMRIGVLDSGSGLPEDVESVFRPFHTTKAHGLGMGLSICRTMVTSHGGTLWAEHGAERGAVFHVALPLAKEVRPVVSLVEAPTQSLLPAYSSPALAG